MQCLVCKGSEESISHLFLFCPWAVNMWKLVQDWLQVQFPPASYIEEFFIWIDQDRGKENRRRFLEVVVVAVLHSIWSHRNKKVFENTEMCPQLAMVKIKEEVFIWIDSRANKIQIDKSSWDKYPFIACNTNPPLLEDPQYWLPEIALVLKVSTINGRSGSPTIILEVVADYDLWICHAYFGMPGTNNDINVLESSHLFSNLAQGIAPPTHYVIQGTEYNMRYYLADSFYPKWSTIIQTIHEPRGPKKKYFAAQQEACRKDVEQAFSVLQSRFAIVKGSSRFWKKNVLHDITTTCIILHNMIC
ncbi:hypothetical protein LXL04_036298 [Taraxacum kok-saghyz]